MERVGGATDNPGKEKIAPSGRIGDQWLPMGYWAPMGPCEVTYT